MRTIRLIEGMEYPEPSLSHQLDHHLLTCEIVSRLQQLDTLIASDEEGSSGGIRLICRLSSLARRSPRAYRLLLDMLSTQHSLSLSYEELGSNHDSTRQSWLQNAQADIEIVREIWPSVGEMMSHLIKRRQTEEADEIKKGGCA